MMLWVHFRHSQEGTMLVGDFLLYITLGMAQLLMLRMLPPPH